MLQLCLVTAYFSILMLETHLLTFAHFSMSSHLSLESFSTHFSTSPRGSLPKLPSMQKISSLYLEKSLLFLSMMQA